MTNEQWGTPAYWSKKLSVQPPAGLTERERYIWFLGYSATVNEEHLEFAWPPLPALPKPFLDSDKSGCVFTDHQMQGYANTYGEVVRAKLSAEIAALRERIAGMEKDAERYRKWVSYSGFTKEHCDATLDAIQINEHAAKEPK